MRANRKIQNGRRSESAQVGIGTMIVFIATVLVAAIAAGVLIDTSAKLQERSSRTGQEASDQVASNLDVQDVVGLRDTSAQTGLQRIEFYLALAPGARNVDLNQTELQVQNGTEFEEFQHQDVADPANLVANRFMVEAMRDNDGSFSSAAPVMTSGDLIRLTVNLTKQGDTANNLEFEPRDHVRAVFMPELGNKVERGFNTPNSYQTLLVIDLL